jgi:hypothetical protein
MASRSVASSSAAFNRLFRDRTAFATNAATINLWLFNKMRGVAAFTPIFTTEVEFPISVNQANQRQKTGLGVFSQLPFANCYLLELPDVLAHGCVFLGMLACPPHQVMEVAAELIEGAVGGGDFESAGKSYSAFAADSGSNLRRFNVAIPGDSAITVLV